MEEGGGFRETFGFDLSLLPSLLLLLMTELLWLIVVVLPRKVCVKIKSASVDT